MDYSAFTVIASQFPPAESYEQEIETLRAKAKEIIRSAVSDEDWVYHIDLEVRVVDREQGTVSALATARDPQGTVILDQVARGNPANRLRDAVLALLSECDDLLLDIDCRCDEAWTSRGMHEANTLCHSHDPLMRAVARVRQELGEKIISAT